MDGCDFPLRHECRCGSFEGVIQVKGGQNVVYCKACGKHAGFNAPKNETGEAKRSLSKSDKREPVGLQKGNAIKMRDYWRCVCCGRGEPDVNLQIGHVLSVKDAREMGLTDEQINHEENLITQCEACNSGLPSLSARFYLALLIRRYAPVGAVPTTGCLTVEEWELCSTCQKRIPKTGAYDCGAH